MRDACIHALSLLARQDPRVVLITGDLGFGVLTGFARDFPKQFINAGVAEQNMTALATGMALEGFRVYTYSIGNFPTLRCLEHIRNDVCYHNASVTIISVGGGFSYGQLGMSHFATEDLAILRALPNMTVVAPTETWETEDLLLNAYERGGPCYFRLDKGRGGVPRGDGERATVGKIRRVREGRDVSLVAIGAIVAEAVAAANALSENGVEARVLAVNSIKPLDRDEVLAAAKDTGGVVTIEEHSIIGGLGGACAELYLESGCSPRVFRRIGLNDVYPKIVGDQNYLRAAYRMDSSAIVDCVCNALARA